MTVTPASLKALYTEFDSATDAQVQGFIDAAELELDEDVFGDLYDRAVMLLTCHHLAMVPDGRPMRLDPEGKASVMDLDQTAYGQRLKTLGIAYSCGHARIV